MGKLILCTSALAKNPYVFTLTKTKVYSIEEISYYLYNNIYSVYEDILDDTLINWVKDELRMEELSKKLGELKKNRNNMRDIVVTILCSNDYYSEKEITAIIAIIDDIMNLPAIRRQKIKADNYLKYHSYNLAIKEYKEILSCHDAKSLSEEEYGNIVHNLAVTQLYVTSFHEAAIQFKKAYGLNHNVETLHQYLLALCLAGEYNKLLEQLKQYNLPETHKDQLIREVERKYDEAEEFSVYKELKNLPDRKAEGDITTYYNTIDILLAAWKQDYRHHLEG